MPYFDVCIVKIQSVSVCVEVVPRYSSFIHPGSECVCSKWHICGVGGKWPWAINIRLCLVVFYSLIRNKNSQKKAWCDCELWGARTNKTWDHSRNCQEWVQSLGTQGYEANQSRHTCPYCCWTSTRRFSSPISRFQSPHCAALEWQSHLLIHVHGPQVLIQCTDLTLRQPLCCSSRTNSVRCLLKSTRRNKTQCLSSFLPLAVSRSSW